MTDEARMLADCEEADLYDCQSDSLARCAGILATHVRSLLAERQALRARLQNDDYLISLLRDKGYEVRDPHDG